MSRPKLYDYDSLALELDEWLEREGPQTIKAIVEHLEVREPIAKRVIHHHRQNLSMMDRALITESVGVSHHVYSISTDPVRITGWAVRRIRDGYTRQVTIHNEMAVALRLVDKRTADGKWVGLVEFHTRYMIEHIQKAMEDAKPPPKSRRKRQRQRV